MEITKKSMLAPTILFLFLTITAGNAQAVPYPFFDDFESGLTDWVAGGLWGLTESNCLDGNFAVTDSPDGNYPDNYNGTLTLATSVDLSTATSPVLIFWHKMWIEYADYAYVEVSTDGGFTWAQLTQWYSQAYLSTWTLSRFDLSDYVGQQVKIRFRLRETNVNVSDGWYVDNVEIREADAEPLLPYPFADDFEGGLGNWLVSGCEWTIIPSDCLDGSFAVTDSPLGSYPNNANSMITLAGDIDLSTATSPVLIFWHKMSIEYADYALAEISADGGLTWFTVTQWYSQAYLSTWTLSRFDLSAYAGEQVKIRFRLRETNVNVADGWYIDKVEIREADDEPVMPYPFSDDFEGDLSNWLVSGCDWALVSSDECAGGFSVTDSPLGNYPDNANSMITLAGDVDLSTANFPVLSFYHKLWIEYADYALVEVSTDSGLTWSTLEQWYSQVYLNAWGLEQYDLSPYIGMQIVIRFRIREANVNVADGWYIDTVSIGEFDATDGDGVPDELDNCSLAPNWCQRDTDADGFGNMCDADLNQDDLVNPADYTLLRNRMGTSDPDADLNGDSLVNPSDYVLLRNMFGQPPGPSGLVAP